jgi:polyhydroxyalkanoate synthesis regulator phasin
MPHWSLIAIGCLITAAFVEVIRRTRKASREQLADYLDRISASLAEAADDVESDRSSPAKYTELVEQLDDIRTVLGGNSLTYGVRDDLIVGLSEVQHAPSQTAGPGRARRLTQEVGEQLKAGSGEVEAHKMRRVSRLFKSAARAMKPH